MSTQLLRKLLMKFHVKKTHNGKLTFKSSSAFNSFGSAIRYFHELSDENKPEGHPSIMLSQECIEVASMMCKGRKRIMASLKAKGLLNGVNINQEQAIKRAVQEIVNPLAESVMRLEKQFDSISRHGGIAGSQSGESAAYEPNTTFKSFCWGGRIHNFPENFVMPGENCSAVWILWLFGNSEESIAPYRSLYTKYMNPNERAQHSKAKFVMDAVLEESGQTYDDISAKGPHEALKIFEENYSKLLGQKRNFRNLHFSTVYKHLKKAKNT